MDNQITIVTRAINSTPKTMLQLSFETNIERASICRYLATLRKTGLVKLAKFGFCPITNHRAGFYTSNTPKP